MSGYNRATPVRRVEVETRADDELLTELRARVARSVIRACPSWLAAQTDDIVQVAMIKVVRALAVREGNTPPPSSYIWKVAYSATVDEIRRRRRMREVPLEEANNRPAQAPDQDPARVAETRQIGEALRECLERLAPNRRRTVVLFLQGHTVPESSRLLGWTVRKVENLVFRGLADLRVCLTAKGMKP